MTMKSKVKRILSIVMTVCIVSTMIPLTAYGADVDFGDDTTVAGIRRQYICFRSGSR